MTSAQRAQIPVKTLQAVGGYADLTTLQDRYVHTQNEDIEAARAAIEDIFCPPTAKKPDYHIDYLTVQKVSPE